MAFSIMTLSIERRYAECQNYFNVMLTVVMLNVVLLSVVATGFTVLISQHFIFFVT